MSYSEVDLEDDSWLQDIPPRLYEPIAKPSTSNKKRAKALNIDDLLRDHYKEKNKSLDQQQERNRKRAMPDSDDSDDEKFMQKRDNELKFENLVESCEKQVHGDGATLDVPRWGAILFSKERHMQKDNDFLTLESPALEAIQTASEHIIKSFPVTRVEGSMGKELLSELLASGWLLMFGSQLDDKIMRWVFYTMVFSDDKKLGTAACNVLCQSLRTSQKQTQGYNWIPPYDLVRMTFKAYGYVDYSNHFDGKGLTEINSIPENLDSFLQFLAVAFKTRQMHQIYSTPNAEDLLVLLATLPLDWQLLSLGPLIQECLVSIASSFREDEWPVSCERVAASITSIDRSPMNCLRIAHSLHSTENRLKRLQSFVALQFFSRMSAVQIDGGVWKLLSVFQRVDLKKNVDFVSLYHQICLADIWLWSSSVLMEEQFALDSWILFLKSCSFQISSTDWRPYASKVRNWASYLLQVYSSCHQGADYKDT